MINKFRLKARSLQIGNVKLFSLLLVTFAVAIFAVNLLPLLYENTVGVIVEKNIPYYSKMINFAVALLLCFAAPVVYFSLSSSIERSFFMRTMERSGEEWNLFYYFSFRQMFRNFAFRFKLFMLKFAVAVVCMLPFFVCLLIFAVTVLKGMSLKICTVMAVACFVFLISAIVSYKSFTSSLFLCPYYFYKGEKLSFNEAVRLSQEKMKKKKSTLTKMKFSFLGWFLLCLLIFPIGYVWSYYRQSLAVAANSFMNS